VTAPDAVVIDADGHATEDWEAFMELLPEQLWPLAPHFGEGPDGRFGLLSIEGRRWEPNFELATSAALAARQEAMGEGMGSEVAARVGALDAEGIDLSVLYPSLGLFFGLYRDPETAAAMCEAQNRWVAGWCDQAPTRLAAAAVLPQQDPGLAAVELRRAVADDGLVVGMVRPNPVAGRRIDEPDFDVLWQAAVDLDVPVVLHEGWMGGGYDTIGLDRARSYAAAHAMSHPFEQMAALLAVVEAGILVRFPTLRLGFFEAGCGWAPWWQERIADHVALFPQDFPHGGVDLAERVWLTFEPGEPGIEAAADAGWRGNLCFASDYPHLDATFPGAVEAVRKVGLPAPLEAAVLGGNALRFYGDRLARRLAVRA
jgi:predicted TIM-barrel fold metal-dependent hydrolase